MSPLLIDLQEVTLDLLEPTDSPALADALQAAISPQQLIVDGAGFDNNMVGH